MIVIVYIGQLKNFERSIRGLFEFYDRHVVSENSLDESQLISYFEGTSVLGSSEGPPQLDNTKINVASVMMNIAAK